MSDTFQRPQIVKTKDLKRPNLYTQALEGEFSHVAFSEERGPLNKGHWRERVFEAKKDQALDVEIGTGNGVHFRTFAQQHPERLLVGVELKFKPLIQTIRGALRLGCKNARVVRYHAFNLDLLFAEGEIDNLIIHFPDPWTSPRKPKNRILNPRMLEVFHRLQKPGSRIHFKTDSQEAFDWSLENLATSSYRLDWMTRDLYRSDRIKTNIPTQFEKIFVAQGLPIYAMELVR